MTEQRSPAQLSGSAGGFVVAPSPADEVSLPPEVFVRAVAASAMAISVADAQAPDMPLVYVNTAFTRVTGYSRDQVLGRNCRLVQGPHRDEGPLADMRASLEARRPTRIRVLNQRPDGQDWWNELHLSYVRDADGAVTHVLGLQHDVTEQVLAERDLQQLAYRDPLTGLPNRRQLEQHLVLALARAGRTGDAVAVLALDLNGFKAVNDAHGHPAGDVLLCQLAQRLTHAVRSTDLVARLGGDEFVVLLADLPPQDARAATSAVAAQIERGLRAPFVLPDATVHVTASIGAALHPQDAASSTELLRRADRDMYRNKLTDSA